MAVDCRESRDLMSGAVDNELNRHESEGFNEHIEICGSCRDEYELEKLTKAYLKRKITFVDVPYDLEATIMARISSEGTISFQPGFFSRLLSNTIFQPVATVGIMLAIAVVLFFANRSNVIGPFSPAESIEAINASGPDVLTMAMDNFQDVMSGKFEPQITATKVADVSAYLKQNAGVAVPVPSIRDADWIEGSVTDADGAKVTHVVFKIGDGYIYIYSFPREAMNSKRVRLPSDCASAIEKNKWYWGMDENGDTQAVWSDDSRVCVATANIDKRDLINYLRTSGRTAQ